MITLKGQFFKEAERSYHFDHWLHVSKISLPSDFMQIVFMILYMYIASAGAGNPFRPNYLCQQKGFFTSTSDFTHIFS